MEPLKHVSLPELLMVVDALYKWKRVTLLMLLILFFNQSFSNGV